MLNAAAWVLMALCIMTPWKHAQGIIFPVSIDLTFALSKVDLQSHEVGSYSIHHSSVNQCHHPLMTYLTQIRIEEAIANSAQVDVSTVTFTSIRSITEQSSKAKVQVCVAHTKKCKQGLSCLHLLSLLVTLYGKNLAQTRLLSAVSKEIVLEVSIHWSRVLFVPIQIETQDGKAAVSAATKLTLHNINLELVKLSLPAADAVQVLV